LTGSDDFRSDHGKPGVLLPRWQWNHVPDNQRWRFDPAGLVIESGKVCRSVLQARNVLTQRARFPACSASVLVDGSGLRDGDYAGIAAFQGCYGLIALVRDGDGLSVRTLNRPSADASMNAMPADGDFGSEMARIPVSSPLVRLKVELDFRDMRDTASFFVGQDGWRQLGPPHRLFFKLDHFTGCRIGLFVFSTRTPGGQAVFREFLYE
jgi:beta-xylosidase